MNCLDHVGCGTSCSWNQCCNSLSANRAITELSPLTQNAARLDQRLSGQVFFDSQLGVGGRRSRGLESERLINQDLFPHRAVCGFPFRVCWSRTWVYFLWVIERKLHFLRVHVNCTYHTFLLFVTHNKLWHGDTYCTSVIYGMDSWNQLRAEIINWSHQVIIKLP